MVVSRSQACTAIDPRTNSAFTNLADAQHNAVTVEGVKMAVPTGAADSVGTAEASGYKGKHHQPKPPSTQTRPASTTQYNKGGPSSSTHKGRCPPLLLTSHLPCLNTCAVLVAMHLPFQRPLPGPLTNIFLASAGSRGATASGTPGGRTAPRPQLSSVILLWTR